MSRVVRAEDSKLIQEHALASKASSESAEDSAWEGEIPTEQAKDAGEEDKLLAEGSEDLDDEVAKDSESERSALD